MKPLQIAGTLMLLFCLLAAVNATPGKVYINGQCIDCNKPDNDDGIIMPPDHKTAGSMSYTLTSGAVFFGIMYHLFS
ncbi:bomanin-836 [Drosophila subpulchrella]|uniref:bomanin-836 n=1 Tax=Drosophila subpulchrella TaxID=1486046 RepID=UPI0018A1A0E9|nr:bomanin-836 [Drosophila subpulchrella]